MASVTQTIPQFSLGMSEQPDNLKFPGQVTEIVNAIPDVTRGLFKRPGAKRIGTDALTNVQSGGSWFHYFRDESEGSYIGQVAADGQVRVWRCSDGTQMTTSYTHDYGDGNGAVNKQTEVQNYLATSDPENLQFLTINDTTFVSSRDSTNSNTLVGSTGTTQATPDPHFAMIELLRTENGRQYGLDIFDSATVTSLSRATRVKISSDTLDESDGTGTCPGIGTQVFSTNDPNGNGSGLGTGNGKNLIFRIDILGQQGVSPNYNASSDGPDGQNYRCSYQRDITLLHGGEGWAVGDTVTVTLDSAQGGAAGGNNATYTVRVEEIETTQINATVFGGSNGNGLVRPEPTPFDAQTAVTADTIIGGIIQELPSGLTAKVIGNGIYLSSNNSFTVNVVESDTMRVMQTSVNDVQGLPNQCKHGYIVKVANALRAEEDDYYLKFEGQNGNDGNGSWVECAKPVSYTHLRAHET